MQMAAERSLMVLLGTGPNYSYTIVNYAILETSEREETNGNAEEKGYAQAESCARRQFPKEDRQPDSTDGKKTANIEIKEQVKSYG